MGGIVMRAVYQMMGRALVCLVALPTAIFFLVCLAYIIAAVWRELRGK